MSEEGKYRIKLRLIDVPRLEDEEQTTEYFFIEEDEEIVDTSWFSGSVFVTVAKTEWGRYVDPETIPCDSNCRVTPETARCHPESQCQECAGTGRLSTQHVGLTTSICSACNGNGA